MRIFYTCYNDLSRQAGDVRHIMEIAQNLKELGHDILVFAPRRGKYKQKTQAQVVYVPLIEVPILNIISYSLLLLVYLMFHSLRKRPNIIYSRDGWSLTSFLFAKLVSRPLVIEVQIFISIPEIKKRGFELIKYKILYFISAVSLIFSDRVVTTTNLTKQRLSKFLNLPSHKIIVVPCGADAELFRPMNTKEVRTQLNLRQDCYYVGMVGSLYPHQGVDYLINSTPFILKELPNTKFIIVGEGIMKKELIKLVTDLGLDDKIFFSGEIPYEDVPKYINAFDICAVFFKPVIPYTADPIKLYEYLACAKPVVVSGLEWCKDFLDRVDGVVWTEASDAQKLTGAIVRLLKDEGLREKIGKHGREAILEQRTWIISARKVEAILRELTKS
ncbi:MAG: glycosyltransferase family 4 protein [Candidatus Omnitrophota bacterium]